MIVGEDSSRDTQTTLSAPALVDEKNTTTDPPKPKPKKIIRRRRGANTGTTTTTQPKFVIDEALYQQVTSSFPIAYEFEIRKTVERCVSLQTRHIALQLPEGLLLYSTTLADVLIRLVPCLHQVSILGDVTYGACCIDDIGAALLGAELLVHYGHSCLIPVHHSTTQQVPVLYVFVEIQIQVQHVIDSLLITLKERNEPTKTPIYLLATIQFRHALVTVKNVLEQVHAFPHVYIPQVKPLSAGEVLGCTSPTLEQPGIVCFVADGRFHLESTMMANPHMMAFYRYDPYPRTMTLEEYDYKAMKSLRGSAIELACQKHVQTFGIILGTLGRQGNPAIVQRIKDILKQHNKRHFLMLVSEITPAKLKLFANKIDCWVQVACPRLSIDWGHLLSPSSTNIPVLNTYEFFCVFDKSLWKDVSTPMDYYSQTGGPWANYHAENQSRTMTACCKSTTNKECECK